MNTNTYAIMLESWVLHLKNCIPSFYESLLMKLFAVCLTLLLLIGCATVGREISTDQVSQLKKGETTIQQATAILGQPTGITTLSDGRKNLTYSFAHVQARPESFIPFVGVFVGGSDVRASALVLTFTPTGILQEYTSHQSTNGSSMGLAAGTYQPADRSLPQEASKAN